MFPLCLGASRAGASVTIPVSGSVVVVAHEESPSAVDVSKREGESGEFVRDRGRVSYTGGDVSIYFGCVFFLQGGGMRE